jgi:hypothetical protein
MPRRELEENPSFSPFSKENENYDKIDKTKEINLFIFFSVVI